MVKVRVLIPNFRDRDNKHLGLLQPGQEYDITEERAKELSEKKIVEIIKPKVTPTTPATPPIIDKEDK